MLKDNDRHEVGRSIPASPIGSRWPAELGFLHDQWLRMKANGVLWRLTGWCSDWAIWLVEKKGTS